MELPSYRTTAPDLQENDDNLRVELNLLEERREVATLRAAAYQQRMAKYHDAQVKPRVFQPGDLVLRKVDPMGEKVGSLNANWEGPYKVTKITSTNSYQLKDKKGEEGAVFDKLSFNLSSSRWHHPCYNWINIE